MKNSKILFILLFLLPFLGLSQNEKFVKAMEKNIQNSDSAKTAADNLQVVNAFERIGNAEKKEWLPFYYAGFVYAMIGSQESDKDKQDDYYDKGLMDIAKADSLSPKNAEIYVVHAMLLQMKIGVDPMSRGMKLGPESGKWLNDAITLDPENPRAYFLRGQGTMFRPEMFGGGKDKAVPDLEKSVQKFAKFKPASTIMPKWGEKSAKRALENCKKKE